MSTPQDPVPPNDTAALPASQPPQPLPAATTTTTTADAEDDTKSDATIAGSSVAITEAEEDAASYAMSINTTNTSSKNNNNKGLILTKDSSLEISINNTPVDVSNTIANEDDNAAPMHFHVLRTPARLKGAHTASGPSVRSRSSSRSRPGSRRNSQSPARMGLVGLDGLKTGGGGVGGGGSVGGGGGGAASPNDGMSATSSLADISDFKDISEHSHHSSVDPDILLDKLGFRDLDPDASQAELQEMLLKHLSSNSSLPTLNERMSEETMEDVHAFQDLVFVKKGSEGSGASGKKMKSRISPVKTTEEDVVLEEEEEEDDDDERKPTLNTLDEAAEEEEEEEEDDDDEEEDEEGNPNEQIRSPASSISGDDEGNIDGDDVAGTGGNREETEVDLGNLIAELEVSNAQREGSRSSSNRISTMAVAGNKADFIDDGEDSGR